MEEAIQESTKDTSRVALLAAISTVITYTIGLFLPETPEVVTAAIITLVLIAIDSYIHHDKSIKANGLLPW